MKFSITPLLLHSEAVPPAARAELRAAYAAPPAERTKHLESAAQVLRRAAGIDCRDALELVGLDASELCSKA